MKKRFFLGMVAVMSVFATMSAAATYKSIKLRMVNPEDAVCIQMEEGMTVSVAGNALVMECALGTIAYPLTDVTGWTFSPENGSNDLWAGIEGVTPDGSEVTITVLADKVLLGNLPAGASVTLTAVTGVQLYSTVASEREIEVDLSSLQPGVYVLNAASQSLKIAVGL